MENNITLFSTVYSFCTKNWIYNVAKYDFEQIKGD